MNSIVKTIVLLFVTGSVSAQPKIESLSEILVEEIIAMYADSTGEKVVIDPRVKGRVRLIGHRGNKLSYSELSTILNVHNFAAYKSDDYLVVVPQNIIKQQAIDLVQAGQQYATDEVVKDLIFLDKLCPSQLIPLLRPLLSPTSHFAMTIEPRSMLITGTYGNTQRIRNIVEQLDSRLEKKQSCSKSK